MTKKFLVRIGFTLLFTGAAGWGMVSCSSTSTSSGGGSCASGSNDFYVVENASCASASGKLSRVNPDVPCKAEILTGLNCPIDFVLSTVDSGIGYLSSRDDGIYQVNITAGTKTNIATTTNIVSPAGLSLLENITEAERDGPCGGNSLVDAILLIADEGTSEGGMIWRWCLITDDADILAGGTNPSPVSEVGPAQLQNPRGVVVASDRTTVYAIGHNPDVADSSLSGLLVTWQLDESALIVPTHLTSQGDFSSPKDMIINSSGNVLIADSGKSTIFQYNPTTTTTTTLTGFTGGPRDILARDSDYLVSFFDDGEISSTTLEVGSDITSVTTGLTFNGPDGIAK